MKRLLIVSLLALASFRKADLLKVTVFYDVQPLASRTFFRKHDLVELYKRVDFPITFDFIPFGDVLHPHKNGTNRNFVNRAHCCALATLTKQKDRVDFVGCAMRVAVTASLRSVESCINRLDDNVVSIQGLRDCARTQGYKLLEENALKLKAMKGYVNRFPTVIFDDTYEIGAEQEIEQDFFTAVVKRRDGSRKTRATIVYRYSNVYEEYLPINFSLNVTL